jgi:hypothetical protein
MVTKENGKLVFKLSETWSARTMVTCINVRVENVAAGIYAQTAYAQSRRWRAPLFNHPFHCFLFIGL